MRPKGTPDELYRRRLRAIELLNEGSYRPVDVAKMVGVNRRSVRRWNATKKTKGLNALKAKPAPGRPSRLTPQQKEWLRRQIVMGAEAHGFANNLWTCPRIAKLIQGRFKVGYHADHVSKMLHSLGFSPQKPERRAIERDEKRIARWIKSGWYHIKKKPKT